MLDICWHFNRSGNEKLESCIQKNREEKNRKKVFIPFSLCRNFCFQLEMEKNKLILNGETKN